MDRYKLEIQARKIATIAHHEAGHAVAAFHVGMEAKPIKFTSGDETESYNPNGSVNNIAGIVNSKGNVLGMMPHPEKASEKILGGEDGKRIFTSIIENISQNV